jgi:hypothetical protein
VSYPRARSRANALPVTPVRMQLSSDGRDLSAIEAALIEFDDSELCALIDWTNNVTHLVPGLLTWIGHACDWELHRRADADFPLLSPLATIPPDEDAMSIVAALTLRERFDQGGERDAGAVVALFDAILRLLTGGERRH